MSEHLAQFQKDLAEVPWKDLRIHLQRGAVILVASELDMLDTAVAVAEDDKDKVAAWIGAGQLIKPSSEQIEAWESELEKPFRMLIVQPFILAQEVLDA